MSTASASPAPAASGSSCWQEPPSSSSGSWEHRDSSTLAFVCPLPLFGPLLPSPPLHKPVVTTITTNTNRNDAMRRPIRPSASSPSAAAPTSSRMHPRSPPRPPRARPQPNRPQGPPSSARATTSSWSTPCTMPSIPLRRRLRRRHHRLLLLPQRAPSRTTSP